MVVLATGYLAVALLFGVGSISFFVLAGLSVLCALEAYNLYMRRAAASSQDSERES